MSKRQPFTPGPWTIEDPMGPEILSIVSRGERQVYEWRHVAQLSAEPDDADDIPAHEAKGNARLIAAAPDMLKALEGILSAATIQSHCGWYHEMAAARVAVAKATGATPDRDRAEATDAAR